MKEKKQKEVTERQKVQKEMPNNRIELLTFALLDIPQRRY